MPKDTDYQSQRSENNRRLRTTEGELQHLIDMFGDELASRYGFKKHRGIQAVWWFLIEKYKWTPATVRALNHEDLAFLLEEERSGKGTSLEQAKLLFG